MLRLFGAVCLVAAALLARDGGTRAAASPVLLPPSPIIGERRASASEESFGAPTLSLIGASDTEALVMVGWPEVDGILPVRYELERKIEGGPWAVLERVNPELAREAVTLPIRQIVQLRVRAIDPLNGTGPWSEIGPLWAARIAPNRSVITVSAPPSETILVAGDIAGCAWNGDRATARLIQGVPGIVMTAGDNAYPTGSLSQFLECYDPTWGQFRDRTRPVPGNHDRVSADGAGYFDYFGTRAGPRGRGYYVFTAGTWRVYALDTNCGAVGGCEEGSAQYRWLKADLLAHPRQCVLAVWHHPRYSSGPHGDSTASGALLKLLYDHGAELVVAGHDHTYERFAPIRPNGRVDRRHGVRMFVVGTGGAPHYDFPREPAPGSRVRHASTYGVLKLRLRPGGYEWRFVSVRGEPFSDRGSGTCHEAP